MDGGKEGSGVFGVAGGDAAPTLDVEEGVFDPVAQLVEVCVVRPLYSNAMFDFQAIKPSNRRSERPICRFTKMPRVCAKTFRAMQLVKCQTSRARIFSKCNCSVSCPMTVSTERRTQVSCRTTQGGRGSIMLARNLLTVRAGGHVPVARIGHVGPQRGLQMG